MRLCSKHIEGFQKKSAMGYAVNYAISVLSKL